MSSWGRIEADVIFKKDVLKNFATFTGKHLCQSLFFNKAAGQAKPATLFKKESLPQVFSCEFCEIFRNIFSYRTLPVAASRRIFFVLHHSFQIHHKNILVKPWKQGIFFHTLIQTFWYSSCLVFSFNHHHTKPVLYLVYLCPCLGRRLGLGLFMSCLCDLFFIFSLIFIVICHSNLI